MNIIGILPFTVKNNSFINRNAYNNIAFRAKAHNKKDTFTKTVQEPEIPKRMNVAVENFKKLGVEAVINEKEKTITVKSNYKTNPKKLTRLKIDETKLFRDVEEMEGNADFRGSRIKSLRKLKNVGGNFDACGCRKLFPYLLVENIGGYADFRGSSVKYLPNLYTVKGSFYCGEKMKSIPKLEIIGQIADFTRGQVELLPSLSYIGETLRRGKTPLVVPFVLDEENIIND